MTPDAGYVSERLLDAELGRSHEKLAGEIKVLTEQQRGLVHAQDLASRLASEEHRRVQSSIDLLFTKLDALTSAVADVVADRRADDAAEIAVRRWRKRAIGAAGAAATLFVAIAGVLVTAFH